MDLSNFTSEDLVAMKSGDLSKVSTGGLQTLHQQMSAGAQPDTSAGHMALGAAEAAGSAIGNFPHATAHAITDLYNRIVHADDSGQDPSWVKKLQVPSGQAAQDFGQTTANALTEGLDRLSPTAGNAATTGVGATNTFVDKHPIIKQDIAPVAGDVATLAGVKGVGGAIARAPEELAGIASGTRSLMSGTGFDVPEEPTTADVGLKPTADAGAVAKRMAGTSAQPALQIHHQDVGNTIAGAEAGVAEPTAPLTPEALAEGRKAPSAVMGRVATATPGGAVDQGTLTAIDNAGGSGVPISGKGSIDNIQSMRDNLKAALSNPELTGQQKVDWLQALRTKGYKNVGSADPGAQDLGGAQLDAAAALEKHIEDNLPANGDVTIDQFRQARTALAKNHTVEGALKGNDVDLKALGRIFGKNPNLMTDGLGLLGRFSAENPDVVGVPNRLDTPGLGKDLLGLSLKEPLSTGVQAATGWLGRKMLTGSTGDAIQNARNAFAGNRGRFSPIDNTPQPPPGMTASPPTAPPAAPAGGQGGFSLADLLSHGVEQSPSPGLSVGPMGAPAGEGLPFTRNAGHEAGDLALAPEDSWFKNQEPLGNDLAGVMSSKVPTGTMARSGGTQANTRLGDVLDIPGTRPQVSLSKPSGQAFEPGQRGLFNGGKVENNASGESAASLEAQSRLEQEKASGSQPFMIDPDGAPQPLLHNVDAVDKAAPKGHLKVQIDPSTGKLSIMDRGGLPLSAAKGLLNRYLSHQSLGDALGS